MSRPLRIERAGGWYHATARGNERRPIARDDTDRAHFVELLEEIVERFGVHLHGYLGRQECGLKLRELALAAVNDERAVSIAIQRFKKRLERSPRERERLRQVCQL